MNSFRQPIRSDLITVFQCCTHDEVTQLTHSIAQRIAHYLERQGLLVRDAENSYLTGNGVDADSESPMNRLLGS